MGVLGQSHKETEINRIIDAVSQAIGDQRLPPGTRLVEHQLVEAFGANRNHVRAAIQRLALRRIVTISPNKGASVSEPTLEEASDVLAARALVEQGIIENLVGRASESDLLRLTKHVEKEKAAKKSGNRREIIKLSGDFHLLLATLSGNKVLAEILNDLITRSSLIIALYQREKQLDCGCHDHGEIIEAVASGNKLKAVELMKSHLNHIEASLNLSYWKNRTVDLESIFTDT
ncbi:HTH-type transcriptional regulator LutR [Grimontia celer]|uniref:HTH-type transcriptional regulator LutR n=1 Tax=Grimontia celer TaxID=1796497 RepID=A0A128EZJ1_9GAMM|nr:GntR family transcriptional regulator [Grimontia celer]CZF79451.1 HTH-type transcriptional regulator LutR [Grimontia celer]